MPSRVLFLFPLARYMRTHWTDRIRAVVDEGYEVHIGVPFDDDLSGFDAGKVTLHDLPLRRGRPSPLGEIATFLATRKLIRAVAPDILHAVTIRPVVYGGLAARFSSAPAALYSLTGLGFLYASDGALARILRPVVGSLLRFAFAHPNARVLLENPDDRDLLVAQHVLPFDKASVFIGSGLDLDAFAFAAPPNDAIPLITLPSRLLAPKGVNEFVAAARLLKAQGVSARFALVGEGDTGNPESINAATLQSWSREGAVEVWGWQDDIVSVLRASAIVCLPSYYREGAPRILIEAAAIGRPVVTTDWPGCRDIVVDGMTGVLIPPRDAQALARALHDLILSPERRREMGLAARTHAEAAFSSAQAIAHLELLYEALLANIPRKD
ncbi:MAG: glycosyltransferase family 4 protein [Parvibaculaceae bacterium]